MRHCLPPRLSVPCASICTQFLDLSFRIVPSPRASICTQSACCRLRSPTPLQRLGFRVQGLGIGFACYRLRSPTPVCNSAAGQCNPSLTHSLPHSLPLLLLSLPPSLSPGWHSLFHEHPLHSCRSGFGLGLDLGFQLLEFRLLG